MLAVLELTSTLSTFHSQEQVVGINHTLRRISKKDPIQKVTLSNFFSFTKMIQNASVHYIVPELHLYFTLNFEKLKDLIPRSYQGT